MKKLFSLLVLAAACATAWAGSASFDWTTAEGAGVTQNGDVFVSQTIDGVTISADKGGNTNSPKWYSTGTAVRIYSSGTLTIECDNPITEVTITTATGDYAFQADADANVGTFQLGEGVATWTGSANSITITNGTATRGHVRIMGIDVTYVGELASTSPVPTFDPESGSIIDKGDDVTIELPDGADKIFYATASSEADLDIDNAVEATQDVTISTGDLAHGDVLWVAAYTTADGKNNSRVVKANYTINDPNRTFSITLNYDVNGRLDADYTEAQAGQLVTITVTPNNGYELNKILAYYGEDEQALGLDAQQDGTYTFEMPSDNVVVNATFKEADPEPQPGVNVVTFVAGEDLGSQQNAGTGEDSMTKTGVTVYVTKGAFGVEGSNANYRFGASQTATISVGQGKITKIVFNCTANTGSQQYGPDQASTETGTYSTDNKVGTWTGEAQNVEFTFAKQMRAESIEVTYVIGDVPQPPVVAAPLINGKSEGSVEGNGEQTVTITGEGASFFIYTTDGSDPTYMPDWNGEQYIDPFTVTAPATVKAIAIDYNGNVSAVTTVEFVEASQALNAPIILLDEDIENTTFVRTGTVMISSEYEGQYEIIFTIDGSDPSYETLGTNTLLYEGPFEIVTTTTIKAMVYDSENLKSEVASATFSPAPLETPVIKLEGTDETSFTGTANVEIISGYEGVNILYTVDGTDPSYETLGEGTEIYEGPFEISATTTVKAINYITDDNLSPVADALFTLIDGILGDVNGDGEVTVGDVSAIYDIMLGLSENYKDKADVNGDGEITVGDVSAVYDIMLGI